MNKEAKREYRQQHKEEKKEYYKEVKERKRFYCEQCDLACSSNYALKKHLKTSKHLNIVKKCQGLIANNVTLPICQGTSCRSIYLL